MRRKNRRLMRRLRFIARTLLVVGLVLAGAFPRLAGAASENESELFARATQATEAGNFSEAIVLFEQLSDLGAVHPDTSFNRAIAYWQRAESPKQQPGDLGQAAAGFREASILAHGSAEAEKHLQTVHQEISRLRSRRGLDPVVVRPPLGRAVVGLLPESVWASLAILGCAALCIGMVLRRSPLSHLNLAGQINSYAGAIVLVLFGGLTFASKQFREDSREGVVIVHEARLLDQNGRALKTRALDVPASAIPEGASLIVQGQTGRLIHVLWGNTDAWVKSSDVRLLADRS